jgi:zinc transporter ZupT
VTQTRLDGRRFVLLMYAVIVGLTGVLGAVLGEVIAMGSAPRLFFLIRLPPNGLGFGIYGIVTIAVALGIPLVLVVYLSERLDTEQARGKDT